ncbi:MAG: hypothetical protein LBU70_05605 [Chitinispirillales bacterium]|jgi:hypothetical protein|nr:hypothetical protein [Chitinispirillales bacterium]
MAKISPAKRKTSVRPAAKEAKSPKPRNKWTRVFVNVMTHLLANYEVDIIPEYELYKDPMRIDVVVIKLLKNVVIDNTVMRFFRKHNIVEFKGPTDTLNIKAFDRVLSYFYAYLSKNSTPFNEATITFVTVRRPEKLLGILEREREYKIIASDQSGIYYIATGAQIGGIPAMQLVISSELSAEDAELIKAIRNDWTLEYGIELLGKIEDAHIDPQLREILFSLGSANNHILERDMDMTAEEKRFKKLIDDWAVTTGLTEKWKQEAWLEGIEEERKKNAKAMKTEGIDVNTIAKITGLTVNAIKQM